MLFRRREILLLLGLMFLAIGAGIWEFVIIGLLGLLIFALGIVFVFIWIAIAQPETSKRNTTSGLAIFILGLILMTIAAGYGTGLAFDAAMHRLHPTSPLPTTIQWIKMWILSLIASLSLGIGLRLRTEWPWQQCLAWEILILAICPLAIGIFSLFSAFWPITT